MPNFRNILRLWASAVVLAAMLPAQTFTSLYSFGSYLHDATGPLTRVIVGPGGELYGTTPTGGASGMGTVFELLPPPAAGAAWTEVILHSFSGVDGRQPTSALLLGPNGALFGTARLSTVGYGTAFELDPPTGGSTAWPFSVIYNFPGNPTGNPSGALVFGADESLYSLVSDENGSVYSLTPPATPGSAWTAANLYPFAGGSGGNYPLGSLAVSSNGTLFGSLALGGRINKGCPQECGLIYSLTPPVAAGGAWVEKPLYAFGLYAGDGKTPESVILAPTGVLYGTALTSVSTQFSGVIFSLAPSSIAGQPMVETILYNLIPSSDGTQFGSPLVLGPNGVLYGTTIDGGSGKGTVFVLAPPAQPGGNWTKTTLHAFTGDDGVAPRGLTLGPDGTLYGTTAGGGTTDQGTVFALKP